MVPSPLPASRLDQGYDAVRTALLNELSTRRVPPPSFSVDDVMDHVGEDREVPVMNSLTQASEIWNMAMFADYYNTPAKHRKKVQTLVGVVIPCS